MVNDDLNITVGVKSDPIEYRYSYEWLFELMADEGVHHLQLGTFFEIYQLEDDFFLGLRESAKGFGISISSIFTAHRELGGFFRDAPDWTRVARRNYERLIEVGSLVGASHVGSNPGAVLRDRMDGKSAGLKRYIHHMKELMVYAHECKVSCLTLEPMSCLAEPPTLPEEIVAVAVELDAHHRDHPDTARVGYCGDISHGYIDENETQRFSNMELMTATLPYLVEVHVRNTDMMYNGTFGFSEADRARGIVDLTAVRELLVTSQKQIPVTTVIAYVEMSGPKLGRDYSDKHLERELRESIRYVKETLST